MMFTVPSCKPATAGHLGYVAGRYRDGAASDQWTDVRRCAEATFTAFTAACSCGWRARWEPADAVGLVRARRRWLDDHLPAVDALVPAAL